MDIKQPTVLDLLIEAHVELERQGPGSPEMTRRALGFLDDLDRISCVADLGCGSGGQTMVLAQHLAGTIIGLDLFPDFIDAFNEQVRKLDVGDRVRGVVGSMDDLPFENESFDLIWSEGAIDNIGFETGLVYWHRFLKANGYVVVTCPSWLTEDRPAVVAQFWTDAGSGLDSVEHNINVLQTCGYQFVASFALPETCWTDHYFTPRDAALEELARKYAGNETAEAYLAENRREVELYAKFKQHYGYVFYIGKKL